MKGILFNSIFCLITITACQNKPEPAAESPAHKLHLPVKAKSDEILFYKAEGKNPDWQLTVMSTEEGNFPTTFTLGDSQDTLLGDIKKLPLFAESENGEQKPQMKSNELKYSGQMTGRELSGVLKISIVSEHCGEKYPKGSPTICHLSINNMEFSGCGVYLE